MNKKGQHIFVGIMIFVVALIVIVQFISPVKTEIITSRSAGSLDCDNSSITIGNKATCIVMDTTLFYFVGISIAAAAGYLGGRKLFAQQ